MTMSNWKEIPGYDGVYFISDTGLVKSFNRYEKNMVGSPNKLGYLQVQLCKDKNVKFKMVHRLVAEAFIPNPENKSDVNHIDFNVKNNHVSNLEWATRKENVHHAIKNGRHPSSGKKTREADVIEIKKMREAGVCLTAVAEKFGLHPISVSRICNNRMPSKPCYKPRPVTERTFYRPGAPKKYDDGLVGDITSVYDETGNFAEVGRRLGICRKYANYLYKKHNKNQQP